MSLDIYLSVNNREQVIQIPVNPSEFNVKKGQETEAFKTANDGWIRIIGDLEFKTISWNSFFPSKEYSFLKDNSYKGYDYVYILDGWRERRLPIRLTITSGNISIPVVITNFEYTQLANGDLSYTIEFGEFNLLEDEEDGGLTMEQFEEIKRMLEDITNRLEALENNKLIYNHIDENMPDWAKPVMRKLIDKGYITGVEENELGLTYEMIRMFVILDRIGIFGD